VDPAAGFTDKHSGWAEPCTGGEPSCPR